MSLQISEWVAAYNLKVLYRYSNEALSVDNSEKLRPIPNWHIMGRFIEWVKDFLSGWERSKKVEKAVLDTLILVDQDKEVLMFNPGTKREGLQRIFYPTPMAEAPTYLSIVLLTNKIFHSKFASNQTIFQITQQITNRAGLFFQKIEPELKQGNGVEKKTTRILGERYVTLDLEWSSNVDKI